MYLICFLTGANRKATFPCFWLVTIELHSVYTGIGDRTGNVQLGMAQYHVICNSVSRDKVIRAKIDDVWGEISQETRGDKINFTHGFYDFEVKVRFPY